MLVEQLLLPLDVEVEDEGEDQTTELGAVQSVAVQNSLQKN